MRNQFRDIIPSEKRSIRNIPLGTVRSVHAADDDTDTSSADIKTKRHSRSRKSSQDDSQSNFGYHHKTSAPSKLVLWLITLGTVFVLFLTLTHFLNSATVTVVVKSWNVEVPSSIQVSLNQDEGDLQYSTATVSDTKSVTLDATGEKEVSSKASGTIVIYNNFDSNPQKLVAGTRFESSNGLIYKIDSAITVPGMKKVSGKSVPGSTEVKVTAEKAGNEYNMGLGDFTIPGFAGSSRFNKIYARSKTAMTGGDVGKVATVSDSELSTAINKLKAELTVSLKDKISSELPDDQVIVDGISDIEFKIGSPRPEGNKAIVEVTASMKTYMLNGNSLARFLLKSQSGVNIKPDDRFSFDMANVNASISSTSGSVSTLSLSGNIGIQYTLDVDTLKSAFAGVAESEVPQVAQKFSGISNISTNVKPYWKSSLPSNESKIDVQIITK